MATYYWVGGSGTWDGSSTTHWATSSGGAGGALSGTYMSGYIGEVMIWTRALTAAELINVNGYLSTKWAV